MPRFLFSRDHVQIVPLMDDTCLARLFGKLIFYIDRSDPGSDSV